MSDNLKKIDVQKMITEEVRRQLQNDSFTDRRLTDTPTDSLSVVNRRYVNLNGSTANRPTASVLGQFYFDTDDNAPRWYGNSGWVDSSGSPA